MNKKIFSVITVLFLSAVMLCFLVSCQSDPSTSDDPTVDKVATSLTLTETHNGEYVLGEDVDLSEIKFNVNYSDKTTESVTLTDRMISQEDRELFFEPGVHTVTISYAGVTTYLQITVVENAETKKYKATFFSLGGSTVDPIEDVSVITAFPMPEREGYIFDGWYIDVDFSTISSDTTFSGTRVREPYSLTQNTSFYAKWLDRRTCSVVFVSDVDIVLPLQEDWKIRSEEERLHVGDVFQSYSYDRSGRIVSQLISRQGVGLIELPVDVTLWENRAKSDLMLMGDTIVRFQQDRNKNYIGMVIRRKDAVVAETTVHYGEKIDVSSYSLPVADSNGHPIIVEGKKFVNWNVKGGNANKVTSDLTVKANFQTEKCTVSIYYISGDKEIDVKHTYEYGYIFAYSSYEMPTREGYSSRWVVYYNYSKQYICPLCGYTETADHKDDLTCRSCLDGIMQETGFEEMPDASGSITLVEEYTLIQAYHVINQYTISIQNGSMEKQTVDTLKKGNIIMESVYTETKEELEKADKKEGTPFTVEWNATFDYTQYTQNPKLNTPAVISDGYSAQWCYVVRDLDDNQVWYNTKGQIWSDAYNMFMEPEEGRPEGEGENFWTLYDAQGEYIARIIAGIPTEIKNNLNLYAKYTKKDRTVSLRRQNESGGRGVMVRFSIPFYDDFNVYDPLSYTDPDRYVFSPDRTSENDPPFDPVIREKIALYEKVRIYELYRTKLCYQNVSAFSATIDGFTEEEKAEFNNFVVWMSLNGEDMYKMCLICRGETILNGTYKKEDLQKAVLAAFNGIKVYTDDDFFSTFSTFSEIINNSSYGDDVYASSQALGALKTLYDSSANLLKTYGIHFSNVSFENISFPQGAELEQYELTWLYYKDTEAYKFYCRQLNRSQDRIQLYAYAYSYEFLREDNPVYERYSSVYNDFKGTSGYLYYCAGLEGIYTEGERLLKLCLSSKEDVAKFYYYSDTNKEVKEQSGFYSLADGKEDNWSVEWYKTAEMNVAGFFDFANQDYTIEDDLNLYCKDVDNRRYELVFYYNYNFSTNTYDTNMTDMYAGSQEVVLSTDYNRSVMREKYDGVYLSYDFAGWYDVPYYEYLITGYRGNSLRVTSSRTENITYYAHYACATTYTVKIYDKTQSTAYTGIQEYTDGYAVGNNTIEYVLPAGSVLSVADIYKGTQSDNGVVVSGQEYFRQKLYVDYFKEYYGTSGSSNTFYNNFADTFGLTSLECRQLAEAYQAEIEKYQSVLAAVKKQDYSLFTPEEYEYYLTVYTNRSTKAGDGSIADRQAFVSRFIEILKDLSEKNFINVSSFTASNKSYADIPSSLESLTDYLTGQAVFSQSMPYGYDADMWKKYYRNYYVFDGVDYVPVEEPGEGETPSMGTKYYTFLIVTDYQYDAILSEILLRYAEFLEGYRTYKDYYDSYSLQPKHPYFESMNDINAASGYDYEGAGELKYEFRKWYLDASYTAAFEDTIESMYYLADEQAYLDSYNPSTWSNIRDRYFVFDPVSGFLTNASGVYSSGTDYYEYQEDAFFTNDLSLLCYDKWNYFKNEIYVLRDGDYILAEEDFDADEFYFTYDAINESYDMIDNEDLDNMHGEGWGSWYIYFYTYDTVKRKYVQATAEYNRSAVYYSRYKKVTNILAARMAGWEGESGNRNKYYVYQNGEYVEATGAYDPSVHYYTTSSLYMSFIVNQDITLYANWLDSSRGTEGLVYELVTDINSGEKGYVVIDFINKSENTGSYSKQYYYITTNDNNQIPENIEDDLELQIPATIVSYEEASDLAAEAAERWSSEYVNFLTYNTTTYSYESATKTYDKNVVYYNKNNQIAYPVIGIRSNAFDRYRTKITKVDLPLNLYFIEEGVFNLCPVTAFDIAKPRVNETALNYIVVDTNDKGIGVALYQSNYTGRIVGNEDTPYAYTIPEKNTILAFAISSSDKSYTLRAGTKRVGDYVFRNSTLTEISFGSDPQVTSIGKYAFNKSAISSFIIYASIEDIGECAFQESVSLSRIIAQKNSQLKHIGKDAFEGTYWFRLQKGIVRLNWLVSEDPTDLSNTNTISTGAIVGFNTSTGGGVTNYDTDGSGAFILYNESGIASANGNYYGISNGSDIVLYYRTDNAVTINSVIVNSDVILVGDNAFDEEQGFVKIYLNSPLLKYIGNKAFQNCPQLELISLGEDQKIDLIEIGESAFSGCTKLTTIEYAGDISSWCNVNFVDVTANPFDYARYLKLNGNENQITEITIPDTITTIKPYTFYNMTALTKITIGKGVKSIGEYAFYNCTANIVWANDIAITGIGESAFRGYKGKALTIPDTVTEISSYAFEGCTLLIDLRLPSVTKFGSHAIDNCPELNYYTEECSVMRQSTPTGAHMVVESCDCNVFATVLRDSGETTGISQHTEERQMNEEIVSSFDNLSSLFSTLLQECPVSSIGGSMVYQLMTMNESNKSKYNAYTNFYSTARDLFNSSQKAVTKNLNYNRGDGAVIGITKDYILYTGNTQPSYDDMKLAFARLFGYNDVSTFIENAGNIAEACLNFIISGGNPSTDVYHFDGAVYTANQSFIFPFAFQSGNTVLLMYVIVDGSGDMFIWVSDVVNTKSIANIESVEELNVSVYGCCVLFEIPRAYYLLDKSGDLLVLVGIEDDTITEFDVKQGTRFIYDNVFRGCEQLTAVTVSTDLKGIGENAFSGCSSLVSITYNESKNVWYNVSRGEGWNDDTGDYVVHCSGAETVNSIEEKLKFVLKTNDTYEISGCPAGVEILYIPSEHYGKSVTSIGARAFSSCVDLTEVSIPSTITRIESNAFNGCGKLNKVVYLGTLIEWCGIVFGNSTANPVSYALDLYIGTSVVPVSEIDFSAESIDRINSYAFYNCTGITSVTLPDTVISVGVYVFYGCPIQTAVIPSVASMSVQNNRLRTVEIIGGSSIASSSFSGCERLETITIPVSVTTIRNSAFSGCTALSRVNYEGSLADWAQITFGNEFANPLSYHHNLYYNNGSVLLGDTLDLRGSGIDNVKAYAFYNCSNLTTVKLGGIQKIAKYAFANCTSLYDIDFGESIVSIGNFSFSNCYALNDVIIPASVTNIGNLAFAYCYTLYSVWNKSVNITVQKFTDNGYVGYYAKNIQNGGDSFTTRLTVTNGLVIYNEEVDNTAKSVVIGYRGSETVLSLINGIDEIAPYAFYKKNSIRSITIPSGLTSIGEYAFFECTSLASVDFSDAVISIGDYAFTSTSLTSAILPDTLTTIGTSAFADCTSLVMLSIPGTVGKIGADAFLSCPVEDVTLPVLDGSIDYIDNTKLKKLTVNGGSTIPASAFYGCKDLWYVELGPTVFNLEANAFAKCYNLNVVRLDGVLSFGTDVFIDCYRLTEVYNNCNLDIEFGSGDNGYLAYYANVQYRNNEASRRTVDENGFVIYNETVLVGYLGNERDLTVPSGITTIRPYAFYGLADITSVTLPITVTTIGASAFSGCSSLVELTLPFVGNVSNANTNHSIQYPLGYLFGAKEYEGAVQTEQSYYKNTTEKETKVYYLPSVLKKITVLGGEVCYGAFANCSLVAEIALLSGVTFIGDDVFFGCSALGTLTLPCIGEAGLGGYFGTDEYAGSVSVTHKNIEFFLPMYLMHVTFVGTTIPAYAFKNCTHLTDIFLSSSVTSIGTEAFMNCCRLVEVRNESSLVLSKGSEENGYVAYYALAIYTAAYESKLTMVSGYLLYKEDSLSDDCVLVGYIGTQTSLTVPSGRNVVAVNKYAFTAESALNKFTFIDGVTEIGAAAFRDCAQLNSVIFASSVLSIGDQAFAYCSSVRFSLSGLTSLTDIGVEAFKGCATLENLMIPSSVRTIGNNAFEYCSQLYEVTIGDGLTSIPEQAFKDCSHITVLNLPSTLRTIGKEAFLSCSELPAVFIPSSVKTIGIKAFYGCKNLEDISIPESVTSIGTEAFHNCHENTYKHEEDDGFAYYIGNSSNPYLWLYTIDATSALTTCVINESTVHLMPGVFAGKTGLTEITFPLTLVDVKEGAFYGCHDLTTVKYTGTGADWCRIKFANEYANPLIYATNLTFNEESATSVTVPADVTDLGLVFYNATMIETIAFEAGSSLNVIGDNTFYNCSNLTSITIPTDVTSIGVRAFYGCTDLATLSFASGSKLRSIGGHVFYGCSNLTSISIPDSVTSIGSYAFDGCTASIVWGEHPTITTIGSNAFYGYAGTSITIPDSVTNIVSSAFYDCTASIVWGEHPTITTIGGYAFVGYAGTSITIPDSVTSIGNYAFDGCTASIVWGEHPAIATIGSRAFWGYAGTSVTIPDSVTSIGDWAFEDCSGLTSITIPNSVTSIEMYAFDGCTGLTSITIPDSVTSIWAYAFRNCSGLTSIGFGGTQDQWNAIEKGTGWDAGTGAYTVHCTDGDIAK